ncbi:transposase [Streptomyces alanosinicus]|uniref:transposase n=1 Tax=Streptomyces alanosinicus TaxID=68171 RepID=UPI001E54C15B|nr:transposase [Streptomyces alanosinicus]
MKWRIPLLGPVRDDPQSAQRPGFTKEDFHIDWDTRTVTCPNGITSPSWKPTLGDGHPRLSVLFPRRACRECDDRVKCTGNVDGKGRHNPPPARSPAEDPDTRQERPENQQLAAAVCHPGGLRSNGV